MKTARIVVPVIIAVLVTWFLQARRDAKGGDDRPGRSATMLTGDGPWFPIAPGDSWKYEARGVFTPGASEKARSFERTVIRRRADGSFQVSDSVNGQVADTYLLTHEPDGIVMTSLSLDKRRFLFLPYRFGPGTSWQLSRTIRACADEETEDLAEVMNIDTIREHNPSRAAFLGVFARTPCLRVRYERFYDSTSAGRPDWFFDGYRWFARGLGIVKVDLRNIDVPRPDGRVEKKETWEIRELESASLHVRTEP